MARLRPRLLIVLTLMATSMGCAEKFWIRSGPSGADVFVDGVLSGKTPLSYSLSREELMKPHQVRIEREGYKPVSVDLERRLSRGRVTAAFFTLGITAIVRSAYYIEPVFVQLERSGPTQEDQDRLLGESLRNLKDLHRTGKISDAELERRRRELLEAAPASE